MKKPILVSLSVIVLAVLAGTIWKLNEHGREMEQKYAQTRAAEDSLRTSFDLALVSIAEIQDSLSVILPSESSVLSLSQGVEQNSQFTASRKDQVLRSISDLNGSIQKSKEMIRQLEERLDERDVRVAALERIVTNLKNSVAEREQMIATLSERVNGLTVEVAALKTDVETGQQQILAQEQVIENKQREISTVYYVVSPKKELKESGVIRDSGGVIGIGKSTRLTGQFPESLFSRLDTDQQTTLQVVGKKPVVLSGQSSSSYQLVPISLESSELRITDPEEFRKVRYLVIQVG